MGKLIDAMRDATSSREDTHIGTPDVVEAILQAQALAATPGEEFTGGDVNYYLVNVSEPKRLMPYQAECEDIIEALGMTFSEGCAFKAIWRSCAAREMGAKKKGQDPHGVYDAEKVIYYGKRMLAVRKKKAAT